VVEFAQIECACPETWRHYWGAISVEIVSAGMPMVSALTKALDKKTADARRHFVLLPLIWIQSSE
jgi:hypothetical protein